MKFCYCQKQSTTSKIKRRKNKRIHLRIKKIKIIVVQKEKNSKRFHCRFITLQEPSQLINKKKKNYYKILRYFAGFCPSG